MRCGWGEGERKNHHHNNSQQIAIPFMNQKKRVESSCFQFLARSFLPMAQSRIHYLCTNCVHNQMLKSHQQSGIQWAMARKDTTCGTLSAFDHAFNLLKLQLKLEKISLFFCPVCTSPSFLFNIFDSRNVIFFSSIFLPSSTRMFSFSSSCMILIQFIAYLKTHKN